MLKYYQCLIGALLVVSVSFVTLRTFPQLIRTSPSLLSLWLLFRYYAPIRERPSFMLTCCVSALMTWSFLGELGGQVPAVFLLCSIRYALYQVRCHL